LSGVATAATGLAAPIILRWPAHAAEFSYKLGSSSPMEHPLMARSAEAAKKIKEESNGRLEITLYPNSVLGQDTAMIGQTISGALQMYVLPIDLLAPRNAACGIFGVGFAFANYDHVWEAMDGELGRYIRGLTEQIGFFCMDKCFDHGFREITSRHKPIVTPDDLRGMKIRLPVAPYLLSLFRHLNASPTALNFGEVYSALQTGIVDGQENPLILIDTAKLYEVQKYCSITNHVWAGLHVSFNLAAWKRLPPDLQEISYRNFTQAALVERQDWQRINQTEAKDLTAKGMIFNSVDTKPFQEILRNTGFYPEMKKTSGDQAWALLEKYVGPLT
jgi:tripartite ATP-independent transporter DctP family solute receptor